jgi:hypothetical protein
MDGEWLNFRVVSNEAWSYGNVILLGDALRTVHFSIGSGTRMALEDAITLFQTFTATDDMQAAFQRFEQIGSDGCGEKTPWEECFLFLVDHVAQSLPHPKPAMLFAIDQATDHANDEINRLLII